MNFTGFKTEELWTPSKSCLMWLVINSCGTLYWDFVNFVIWPLAISCWSWGHMTDWTLFCFGVISRLNVINTIPVEIISFIQQRGIMSFRIITVAIEIISFIHHLRVFRRLESQYPLLFFFKPLCACWAADHRPQSNAPITRTVGIEHGQKFNTGLHHFSFTKCQAETFSVRVSKSYLSDLTKWLSKVDAIKIRATRLPLLETKQKTGSFLLSTAPPPPCILTAPPQPPPHTQTP